MNAEVAQWEWKVRILFRCFPLLERAGFALAAGWSTGYDGYTQMDSLKRVYLILSSL
jgi:hypothetical protein